MCSLPVCQVTAVVLAFQTFAIFVNHFACWFHLNKTSSLSKKLKWSRCRPGVAQRVGRDIALLFHDLDTRRGWVVSSTPRPFFTPGKTQYPLYRRLGGPQGRSGRMENLVSHRDSIPDRPVRSYSLYRLSYRPTLVLVFTFNSSRW